MPLCGSLFPTCLLVGLVSLPLMLWGCGETVVDTAPTSSLALQVTTSSAEPPPGDNRLPSTSTVSATTSTEASSSNVVEEHQISDPSTDEWSLVLRLRQGVSLGAVTHVSTGVEGGFAALVLDDHGKKREVWIAESVSLELPVDEATGEALFETGRAKSKVTWTQTMFVDDSGQVQTFAPEARRWWVAVRAESKTEEAVAEATGLAKAIAADLRAGD